MSDHRLRIRRTVYAVAAAVSVFAFYVSYTHIYDLGRQYGQRGLAARMLPLSVDLLIVAASLVIYEQREDRPGLTTLARFLPRLMLWAGIAGTIAANVAYGLAYGVLGAVISAWPGAVFAGVAEMVFVTVQPGPREAIKQTVKTAGQAVIPASSYDAAVAAYAASVDDRKPLTEYQLHTRYGIPRSKARKIVAPAALKPPAGTDFIPPGDAVPAGPSLNGNGSHDD